MKILDMPCTKGFMQLAQDGVDKGWHEMNGGNLSYRLTKDEAANVKKVMKKASGAWTDICESVPKLAGEFFMVTRTTGYMRNVPSASSRSTRPARSTASGGGSRTAGVPRASSRATSRTTR